MSRYPRRRTVKQAARRTRRTRRARMRKERSTRLQKPCARRRLPLRASSRWTYARSQHKAPAPSRSKLPHTTAPHRRSFPPTLPPATSAWSSSSTWTATATTTLSSTARTAGRASPSSTSCPTTDRPPRCAVLPCARNAPPNMPTRPTAATMPSRMPALPADLRCGLPRAWAATCSARAARGQHPTRSSSARQSRWQAVKSPPSRVWAAGTLPAMLATRRPWPHCARASAVRASLWPLW